MPRFQPQALQIDSPAALYIAFQSAPDFAINVLHRLVVADAEYLQVSVPHEKSPDLGRELDVELRQFLVIVRLVLTRRKAQCTADVGHDDLDRFSRYDDLLIGEQLKIVGTRPPGRRDLIAAPVLAETDTSGIFVDVDGTTEHNASEPDEPQGYASRAEFLAQPGDA